MLPLAAPLFSPGSLGRCPAVPRPPRRTYKRLGEDHGFRAAPVRRAKGEPGVDAAAADVGHERASEGAVGEERVEQAQRAASSGGAAGRAGVGRGRRWEAALLRGLWSDIAGAPQVQGVVKLPAADGVSSSYVGGGSSSPARKQGQQQPRPAEAHGCKRGMQLVGSRRPFFRMQESTKRLHWTRPWTTSSLLLICAQLLLPTL